MWPFLLLAISFIILGEDLLSVTSTKLLEGPLIGGAGPLPGVMEAPRNEKEEERRETSLENLKSILSITDRLIRVLPFLAMYSYDVQPVLSILLHVLLSLLISVLFHEI